MSYGPETYVDIYPDPHPEVTTMDGGAARNVPSTPYTTWADIRDGAGTAAAAGATYAVLNLQAGDIQDKYAGMSRLFFLFDTLVIPAGARINSAKLCITTSIDRLEIGAPSVAVVPSSPLSNIDLVKADYQNIGTTLYSSAILWTDLTVPHLIDINAAGLAVITPQTIVKLGIREASYDIPNVAPTWISLKKNWLNVRLVDNALPSYRPFLRVWYQERLPVVLPTVTTNAATAVSSGVATLNGTLDDDGGEACNCGFEWGETVAYGNTTPTQSRETGQTFVQALAGLDPDTTYHFRAFAANSAGTGYGSDATFTTDPVDPTISIPTVTTDEPTVEQEVATLNGTLVDNGGEACQCYLEWGRTVAYGTTIVLGTKTTGDALSQQISGLTPNTEYHFRAYARNSAGTGYGADREFTTEQRPEVNFRPVENRAYALSRWEL